MTEALAEVSERHNTRCAIVLTTVTG